MAGRPKGLLTSTAILGLVLVTTAAMLKGLDLVPQALFSSALERSYATIEELERAQGSRLALPAYFPGSLRWPPATVRSVGRSPRSVVLWFVGREGDAVQLVVGQTLDGYGELDARLLPGGVVLDTQDVEVGGEPARLQRILGEDGATWRGLIWRWKDRSIVVRSRGSVDELFTIAASVRKEGP